MFLMTGITGHIGGAVARQLLSAGRQVRALVGEPDRAGGWARQGVELHQGDFNDAALTSALKGVEGAL